MPAVPLRRNRDFVLLQAGQLLSSAGTQATAIAYPLLALALTHSAVKAGLVSFARTAPIALFAVPAGLAAALRRADDALLTAKREGRNQVMLHDPGTTTASNAERNGQGSHHPEELSRAERV